MPSAGYPTFPGTIRSLGEERERRLGEGRERTGVWILIRVKAKKKQSECELLRIM